MGKSRHLAEERIHGLNRWTIQWMKKEFGFEWPSGLKMKRRISSNLSRHCLRACVVNREIWKKKDQRMWKNPNQKMNEDLFPQPISQSVCCVFKSYFYVIKLCVCCAAYSVYIPERVRFTAISGIFCTVFYDDSFFYARFHILRE